MSLCNSEEPYNLSQGLHTIRPIVWVGVRHGHGQVLSFLFLQIVQDLSHAKICDTTSAYFSTCRNASECSQVLNPNCTSPLQLASLRSRHRPPSVTSLPEFLRYGMRLQW
jgi:hypothetical protein